ALLYRRGNFAGTFDDLICDALIAERDAEIALSPGFRWGTSVLPGAAITVEDIHNATAITYPQVYRMTMTGARLKEILEDVADNLFNPDPYYQQGGDMVRCGGVGYAVDIGKPMGSRISGLTHLKSGKPIDAGRDYTVAGWASVSVANAASAQIVVTATDTKGKVYVLPATLETTQWGWFNNAQKPVLTVDSGDTIVMETMMHSHNQVIPGVTIEQIKKLRTDF